MRNLRPLLVVFLTLLSTCAFAAGPVLTPVPPFPGEVQPGQAQIFHVAYTNQLGDPAKTVEMLVDTPSTGELKLQPTQQQGTDPGQGIEYTFNFTPTDVGQYKYHFHAVVPTASPADVVTPEAEFISYNILTKYIFLALGIVAALVILPFVIYMVARSVNKRGNPGTAARVGLLIGVLAAFALYAYLFFTIYHGLGLAIAGVIAVAALIAVFSKR